MARPLKVLIARDELHDLYVTQNKSLAEIGELFGISAASVLSRLRQLGIPRRPPMLSHKSGDNHPKWKGCGVVPGWYWCMVRRNAALRGIALTVTIEDISKLFEKQQHRCFYTGLPIWFDRADRRTNSTASLDRIDSDGDYSITNLQWVHKDVQQMKMDLSHERFVELCQLTAEQAKSKVFQQAS